jgi:putative protease
MDERLPELLAPAGNLEKLKTAIAYGADAVYLGGQRFGLRASADNFNQSELQSAVEFAAKSGAKVYVAMNAFLHDEDFEGIEEYSQFLESVGVSAAIVSDLGVIRRIKHASNLPVHLSTQASCINSGAGRVWSSQGVERLILGREVSLEEAASIKSATSLEVELFIHGSMCMAYSGNCTISNFTAGRDSNRGGCIQSCRFEYAQRPLQGDSITTHFMSSKDLQGLELVPEFVSNGISSLKIEGRMKSLLYVATTTSVYRRALDAFARGEFDSSVQNLSAELRAVPHREHTEASLRRPAGFDSIFSDNTPSSELATRQLLGSVVETDSREMLVRLYRSIKKGSAFQILPFNEAPIDQVVESIRAVDGGEVDEARQDSVVWLPKPVGAEKLNVMRM